MNSVLDYGSDWMEKPSGSPGFKGVRIKCFLCGKFIPVKLTRKERPYFQCLDCYMQCFIRGEKGLKRLRKFLKSQKG